MILAAGQKCQEVKSVDCHLSCNLATTPFTFRPSSKLRQVKYPATVGVQEGQQGERPFECKGFLCETRCNNDNVKYTRVEQEQKHTYVQREYTLWNPMQHASRVHQHGVVYEPHVPVYCTTCVALDPPNTGRRCKLARFDSNCSVSSKNCYWPLRRTHWCCLVVPSSPSFDAVRRQRCTAMIVAAKTLVATRAGRDVVRCFGRQYPTRPPLQLS